MNILSDEQINELSKCRNGDSVGITTVFVGFLCLSVLCTFRMDTRSVFVAGALIAHP